MRPPGPPRGLAGASGAYSGVAELGHWGRHRCAHGGGVDAVFPTFPPTAPTAFAAQTVATAAGKSGQQSLAKTCVHEAVNDGVDTGRRVGQEVDERDGCSWEGFGDRLHVKGFPGIDCEQRHPADEEECYDHHQHADDAPLSLQLSLGGVAAGALSLDLHGARWGREGGKLHRRGGLFGYLDVAAIIIVIRPCQRSVYTIFLACRSTGGKRKFESP